MNPRVPNWTTDPAANAGEKGSVDWLDGVSVVAVGPVMTPAFDVKRTSVKVWPAVPDAGRSMARMTSRLAVLTGTPAPVQMGPAVVAAQLISVMLPPAKVWADTSLTGCTSPRSTAASIAIAAATHLALFGPGLLESIIACVPPVVGVSRNERE